jgi:hypothetical protein
MARDVISDGTTSELRRMADLHICETAIFDARIVALSFGFWPNRI